MMTYTDLHLHLIPGVDDGPGSDGEAVELARILVDDGVTEVAVTPHFNAWNPDLLATRLDLDIHLRRLRSLLFDSGINLRLQPGAEHFLTPELLDQVKSGSAPTLGPGPYILVELPFNDRPLYADDLLYRLELAHLQPVLAHPERYSWVQEDPNAAEVLVARGICLQLTAASLTGHYGGRVKKTAEHLLRRGWYGLVGSDLHHPGQGRLLSSMASTVRDMVGDEAVTVLFEENPARVLRGDPLLPAPAGNGEDPKKRLFGIFG